MRIGTAIVRLHTALAELESNVHADQRAKPPMTSQERRALKSEIEDCMQKLDELRTLLTQ